MNKDIDSWLLRIIRALQLIEMLRKLFELLLAN